MGAPIGNTNAARGTQWRDAIRKAVLRDDRLDALAAALVTKALEGDMAALREIGDRLDGKVPPGRREATENGGLQITICRWADDSDNEHQHVLDGS